LPHGKYYRSSLVTEAKTITKYARRELLDAVGERYRTGSRAEKAQILGEFCSISGFHRKSAIRVLNGAPERSQCAQHPRRPKQYDDPFCQVLTVLWEASDRVCGKRLKVLLPDLVAALERHGHLQLERSVHEKLMRVSAATIDRLLQGIKEAGGQRRVKRRPTALRRSVPIRTFADWNQPPPGYLEIDLVAHCGELQAGSYVHTLTLTDMASTWTECVPLLVRESTLLVGAVDELRGSLPFLLRGMDIDNGAEFLNETLVRYCATQGIELTRSRPYRKNDQAWVEQKNGSVVRRLVGYQRLEGMAAVKALSRLYAASRLFINFFQPSFKLKEKCRIGGRIVKRYDPPQTPCARLLASEWVLEPVKVRLREIAYTLDPLQLLDEIRKAQHQVVAVANRDEPYAPVPQKDDLTRFLSSLANAWRGGEVRPTHHAKAKPPRHWRTRKDPFEGVWPTVCRWLEADPDQTGKALLMRLQVENPGVFPDVRLRTLQRRLKQWRSQLARTLVFGVHDNVTLATNTSVSMESTFEPASALATTIDR